MEELFCTSSNIYKSPSVRFTFCLRAAVIYTLHVCVRVLRMTENAFEYPAGPVISNEADTGSRLNPTDLYLHTSRRLCVLTLCRESWVLTELASVHAGLGPLCCSASNSTKTQWTREPLFFCFTTGTNTSGRTFTHFLQKLFLSTDDLCHYLC